jgi:hypothetical protein
MSYVKIGNFGLNMKRDQSINSQYVYTVLDDPFLHGNTFNAMGRESRLLMVDKCSKNWDATCDVFYRPYIEDKVIDQTDGIMTTTQGMLVKEAAKKRFCSPVGCSGGKYLVDPTTINSPIYSTNDTPCQFECSSFNPKTLDKDPLFDRVLERPDENITLLKNMCNTARRKGIDIAGTKLEKVCKMLMV